MGNSFSFLPFEFFQPIRDKQYRFNVTWMLHQIYHKIALAQQDLALIRNKSAMFLTPLKPTMSTWQCRIASMGLAALAAMGLYGGRLAVCGPGSCNLRGLVARSIQGKWWKNWQPSRFLNFSYRLRCRNYEQHQWKKVSCWKVIGGP